MNYECKAYLEANNLLDIDQFVSFSSFPFYVLLGDIDEIQAFLKDNKDIKKYYIEYYYKNKLMPFYDLSKTKARIEPGAIIRDNVFIHDEAIVLMGAIINTNASIGKRTMIDMNAVIGSGAVIGQSCHIGAGCVIAGIMEPKTLNNVIIEDNVFIGANAVILEGVHIYENAIVGAGAVVLKDVEKNTTVAGVPAKVVNHNSVWMINDELRK